jgi:3-demethoxyubiquinol 3-hydroxylase
MRAYSLLDKFLIEADEALRTIYGASPTPQRPNPALKMPEGDHALPAEARRLAGRLLRVDHAGEVAAQGLYRGQALTARDANTRERMQHSAVEENDHLAWCDDRLAELGSHRSRLGPFWYLGSYVLGAVAGLAGDRWSLGFVNETEQQVVEHIDDHLQRLPTGDIKSRAVLVQMKIDEAHHAAVAQSAGGQILPRPIRRLMRLAAKFMTRTAYWF